MSSPLKINMPLLILFLFCSLFAIGQANPAKSIEKIKYVYDTIFLFDTIHVQDTVYVDHNTRSNENRLLEHYSLIADSDGNKKIISIRVDDDTDTATFLINHIILNERIKLKRSMKKKNLVALGLSLAMNTLIAQTDYGIKIGYVSSHEHTTVDNNLGIATPKRGVSLGVFSHTMLNKQMAFQLGVEYTYLKKAYNYQDSISSKWDDQGIGDFINGVSFHQLMIPISISAQFGKLEPVVGLYFKHKKSTEKIIDTYDNIDVFDNLESDVYRLSKSEALGGLVGLNYKITDKIKLGAQFSMGLLGAREFTFKDRTKHLTAFGEYRNTQVNVSFAYLLME